MSREEAQNFAEGIASFVGINVHAKNVKPIKPLGMWRLIFEASQSKNSNLVGQFSIDVSSSDLYQREKRQDIADMAYEAMSIEEAM